MITAAIVEDQAKDREYLAVLLELYSQKVNVPIKILEYQYGAQLLKSTLRIWISYFWIL